MATGVGGQPEHIACTSCGRKFRYKPELAGRTVKCPCGSAIMVPKPAPKPEPAPATAGGGDEDPFANVDWGGYDVAEPPPAPAKPAPAAAAPAVGLAAPAGSADEQVPGAAAVALPPSIAAKLPPMRKGLKQEERKTNEELVPPSVLRDFILPSILIAIGIPLRFYEVMYASTNPVDFAAATGVVATKLALSVALMLGGMFLAINILDVSFIGALPRTAYKLIGIAIGPAALYGILSFPGIGGEEYGSIIGTFASIAAYGVLFWIIMRLDVKDTAVCVTMTFILVTVANYVGYKVQGLMSDSWV